MSGTLAYTAGLVPEIAGDVEAVDRAMRLGYAWKRGPFEMIDSVGAGWFADKLAQEGREVPPLLQAAAEAGGFYRIADGRATHLAGGGTHVPLTRPGRRAPPLRHQADLQAARPQRLGEPLGHRRRRRLPRIPLEDERARHRDYGAGRAIGGDRRRRDEGAGDPQRGQQLLRRHEPGARALRRERRRLADDRGDGEAGAERLQGAQVRALPGGGRAVRHGARRRLRGAAALRRGAGPRRELHGPRRGRRRDRARLGRLQGDDAARAQRRPAWLRRRDGPRSPRSSRPSARPRSRAPPRRRASSASCARAMPSPPTATACWPTPRPGRWRWRRTTPRPSPPPSSCRARPGASR